MVWVSSADNSYIIDFISIYHLIRGEKGNKAANLEYQHNI